MHLCFSITAHGFGHGAISCALIDYIVQTYPEIKVIKMAHDFGMLMLSPIVVDIPNSSKKYQRLYDHWQAAVDDEIACLQGLNIDCLISNISPISLAAAQQLGIKTASVAPFNWAQIYERYCVSSHPALDDKTELIYQQMAAIYHAVDYIYKPLPSVPCDQNNEIHIGSISSQPKVTKKTLKAFLGKHVERVGLIALGGISMPLELNDWPEIIGWHWIVDQAIPASRVDMSQVSALPYCFLTLLAESDLVLTKPGYGTYCEIASLAAMKTIRVLSLARPDWPETPYLNEFLAQRVAFVEIQTSDMNKRQLTPIIAHLFSLVYPASLPCEQGEKQLAEHLLRHL